MANLKEIRVRITSIKSTRQITSAMKMVSAAKLRKAQDAVIQLREYSAKLSEVTHAVSSELNNDGSVFADVREVNRVLLIVISSNKGLCGGFNMNVIKQTNLLISEKYESQHREGNVHIITIGKKAFEYFKSKKYKVVAEYNHFLEGINFQNITTLVDEIIQGYSLKTYDKVELIYNQFVNAAVQKTEVETFLPLSQESNPTEKIKADYIFEPSNEKIIEFLIPKKLKTQLFKAMLDSYASEQGARMTSMHQATDNASELIKQLSLDYNKARQANITNQILEVVNGAEALNG